MSLAKVLFSTQGRIPRSTYWYYFLGYWVVYFIATFTDVLFGTIDKSSSVGLFSGTLSFIGIVTGIIVAIKRSHDRNHSTKWLLLCGLIPLFNIWVIIELAFLKGIDGDNDYGPNPLRKRVMSRAGI